eukprot:2673378-Karenia_brevis.AAC.1
MLQRRFARTGSRGDDGLKNVTKPGQMFTSDHLIVTKSKDGTSVAALRNKSASGEICAHTIKDM